MVDRKDEYVSVPVRRKDLERIVEGDVPLHVLNIVEGFLREPHSFRPGIYRHYKGGLYRALLLAQHSETGEECVIYMSLENGRVYARPYSSERQASWTDPMSRIETKDPVPTGQSYRFDFVRS